MLFKIYNLLLLTPHVLSHIQTLDVAVVFLFQLLFLHQPPFFPLFSPVCNLLFRHVHLREEIQLKVLTVALNSLIKVKFFQRVPKSCVYSDCFSKFAQILNCLTDTLEAQDFQSLILSKSQTYVFSCEHINVI